jgi:hypothetical protein
MIIKKFKNDNFNLKIDYTDNINNNAATEHAAIIELICNNSSLDFIIGEEYCDGYCDILLYNYNTQKFYCITKVDTKNFLNGKTIKLEGFQDTEHSNYMVELNIL